jgi:hypothetical protein
VSKRDEDQHKSQPGDFYAAEGIDVSTPREVMERLHPSLRESFVPLPPVGTTLTQAQLDAVFAGDLRVLRDLARLAYKSCEDAPE